MLSQKLLVRTGSSRLLRCRKTTPRSAAPNVTTTTVPPHNNSGNHHASDDANFVMMPVAYTEPEEAFRALPTLFIGAPRLSMPVSRPGVIDQKVTPTPGFIHPDEEEEQCAVSLMAVAPSIEDSLQEVQASCCYPLRVVPDHWKYTVNLNMQMYYSQQLVVDRLTEEWELATSKQDNTDLVHDPPLAADQLENGYLHTRAVECIESIKADVDSFLTRAGVNPQPPPEIDEAAAADSEASQHPADAASVIERSWVLQLGERSGLVDGEDWMRQLGVTVGVVDDSDAWLSELHNGPSADPLTAAHMPEAVSAMEQLARMSREMLLSARSGEWPEDIQYVDYSGSNPHADTAAPVDVETDGRVVGCFSIVADLSRRIMDDANKDFYELLVMN